MMSDTSNLIGGSTEITTMWEKYLIAMLAGTTPILIKFVGRDSQQNSLAELIGSYGSTAFCLTVLGLIVCYLTDERNRLKLFMLALSAPALIANFSGATVPAAPAPGPNLAFMGQVSSPDGYTQPRSSITSLPAGFTDGLKRFFGKSDKRFWVIVMSTKDQNQASRVVEKINSIDPQLNAFVGNRRPNNDYFPVIVGGYKEVKQANALLAKAQLLNKLVPELSADPYLDNFPDRK